MAPSGRQRDGGQAGGKVPVALSGPCLNPVKRSEAAAESLCIIGCTHRQSGVAPADVRCRAGGAADRGGAGVWRGAPHHGAHRSGAREQRHEQAAIVRQLSVLGRQGRGALRRSRGSPQRRRRQRADGHGAARCCIALEERSQAGHAGGVCAVGCEQWRGLYQVARVQQLQPLHLGLTGVRVRGALRGAVVVVVHWGAEEEAVAGAVARVHVAHGLGM